MLNRQYVLWQDVFNDFSINTLGPVRRIGKLERTKPSNFMKRETQSVLGIVPYYVPFKIQGKKGTFFNSVNDIVDIGNFNITTQK